MDTDQLLEEFEKCKDIFYFYNNYIREFNQPELTREEFEKRFKHLYLQTMRSRKNHFR